MSSRLTSHLANAQLCFARYEYAASLPQLQSTCNSTLDPPAMQSDGDDGGLSRQQLRIHKNRIISYVETIIPPSVLESGVLIMAMQVDSPVNGSMLHTVISVVFPLPQYEGHEFIPGIKESGEGGTYRTTIYRPLIDVTRDDVLDAFPEQFPGGRRTVERLSYRARDAAIAHLEQDFGEGNADAKRQVAQFVIDSLQRYLDLQCVPPKMGTPFPTVSPEEEVIAAVAKTNMQRKEYAKTRKKVEKMVKDRDQRELEHQQALQAQQQMEMAAAAAALPPTPTRQTYSDDDDSGDPFDNVNNPLKYRDPPGDRASVMGVPLVVDIPSLNLMERTSDERTAGPETTTGFSTPSRSGGRKGAEEPGSSGKKKGSLKKMLKKMQL